MGNDNNPDREVSEQRGDKVLMHLKRAFTQLHHAQKNLDKCGPAYTDLRDKARNVMGLVAAEHIRVRQILDRAWEVEP